MIIEGTTVKALYSFVQMLLSHSNIFFMEKEFNLATASLEHQGQWYKTIYGRKLGVFINWSI
jgi:hypothetical protein